MGRENVSKPAPPTRQDYLHFLTIPTRWMDNDIYGHVNNVVYYSYFDTAIGAYLIGEGGLDIHASPVIAVCAESGCRYHASLTFPDKIEAGLRIAHLGQRAARYEIGLFKAERSQAVADGHFVHVFVERATMRPVEIPADIRAALEKLMP